MFKGVMAGGERQVVLRKFAEEYLQAISAATEREEDLLRASHAFIARAWLALTDIDKIVERVFYRSAKRGIIQIEAERLETEIRSGTLVSCNLHAPELQLALLRAADETAARLYYANDDYPEHPRQRGRMSLGGVRVWPVHIEAGLEAGPIDVDVLLLPRRNRSPAAKQGVPLYATIINHRVLRRTRGRLNFEFGRFGERPRAETAAEPSSSADETVRVYVGGYSTSREWPVQEVDPEHGRKIYFSEAGGLDHGTRLRDIQNHVHEAIKHHAAFIVLPELTISDALLGDFVYWCTTQAFPASTVIVPGTAHVIRDGIRRNEAWLVRGDGVCADKPQYKLMPYQSDVEAEGIDPAKNPTVVNFLQEHWIANILTCIDFCDGDAQWPRLVDGSIILVPSMGSSSTVSAHLAMCGTLKHAGGPPVLISQEMVATEQPKEERKEPNWWACVFDGGHADVTAAEAGKLCKVAALVR
jgi:hypothetical protein